MTDKPASAALLPLRFVVKLPVDLACSVEGCPAELKLDGVPLEVDSSGMMLFDGKTLSRTLAASDCGWVVGTMKAQPRNVLLPGMEEHLPVPAPLRMALCPSHNPTKGAK